MADFVTIQAGFVGKILGGEMQILCTHCSRKARISSRHNISKTISHLYCQCMDVAKCGHTFVMALAFDHTINPPAGQTHQFVLDILRGLPKHERMELLAQAQHSTS